MENCNFCGSQLKHIPAGTSKKTGNAYDAFSVCPNGCKQTGPKKNMSAVDPIKIIAEEMFEIHAKVAKILEIVSKGKPQSTGDFQHISEVLPQSEEENGVNVKDIPF